MTQKDSGLIIQVYLPEAPTADSRLAAPITAIDLVFQADGALVVVEIGVALVGGEVLDLEEQTHPVGFGAHGLGLPLPVGAGEHSAVVVASVNDESPGLFLVGPLVAGAVAGGGDVLDGKEHAAEGEEDGLGLHGEMGRKIKKC